jgi:hypothetical protein
VKYGEILVQFAEKWVLKIGYGVIFRGGFAENGCKDVAFSEKMLFLHRVAICCKIAILEINKIENICCYVSKWWRLLSTTEQWR